MFWAALGRVRVAACEWFGESVARWRGLDLTQALAVLWKIEWVPTGSNRIAAVAAGRLVRANSRRPPGSSRRTLRPKGTRTSAVRPAAAVDPAPGGLVLPKLLKSKAYHTSAPASELN